MPQRLETRKHDFTERVTTALIDLAAFSLRTSTLRSAPPDTLNQLTTMLIHRLAALCHAQQGALFLVEYLADQEAIVNQSTFSPFAEAQMSEEEARAALAAYPRTAVPLQWSVDFPPTLLWRRSLGPSRAHIPPHSLAVSHPTTHLSALLLFVWSETSEAPQEKVLQMRDEARRLLPFLGDVVDTILLHLLMARDESESYSEPLPAELLATLGHEFRGPLTTISGYATTLLRHDQQFTPEERQDFLQAINEASSHLGKLVDRFLELAQFETNAVAFTPAAVDLAALAHEVVAATRQSRPRLLILPSLPTHGLMPIEQGEQASTSEKLVVSGDRRWLQTMLDILLENAIVYSPQERLIEISIEPTERSQLSAPLLAPTDPDTHMVLILPGAFEEHEALLELQVRDHGIGIEPGQLAPIFQRFYRVDTRLTREVNGLGLALCKAIVARHRGMLWVESRMGEGSTFHIVLPCETVPAINTTM